MIALGRNTEELFVVCASMFMHLTRFVNRPLQQGWHRQPNLGHLVQRSPSHGAQLIRSYTPASRRCFAHSREERGKIVRCEKK